MKLRKLVLPAIVAIAFSGGALAQEKNSEISVFGLVQSQTKPSGGSSFGTIYGAYGFYVLPQLVVNVNVSWSGSSTPGGGSSSSTGLGAGLKYYFSAGKKGDFVPFVGGDVMGQSMSGGGGNLTITDLYVGGSYFLSETASMDVKGQYQWMSAPSGGIKTENVGVQFGLTYRF
jgi:hypothetical protein